MTNSTSTSISTEVVTKDRLKPSGMAIARALVKLNPEFRKALKDKGLLTQRSQDG